MTTEKPFKYFKTVPKTILSTIMYYVCYPLNNGQVEGISNERGTFQVWLQDIET